MLDSRTMPDASRPPPCPGCGSRNYDHGRFFSVFGLCAYCFEDEAVMAERRIELRPPPSRPLPPFPTKHKPGSKGKEEALGWRLFNRYALHHPDDATADDPEAQDADVLEAPDPIHPDDLMPGVEMDRSKGKLAWRARPRWRDCRVECGRYAGYREAASAVKAYYVERWGHWDETQPWARQPACLAVVRLAAGWHDLEFPAGVMVPVARRAAARVIAGEPWESWWAAEAALRGELERAAREAA